MIFCGIEKTESIHLHPEENLNLLCTIDLTMDKHEPKFYVYSSATDEWFWEFWFTSNTNYERVKTCIMDVACECDGIAEALNTLSDLFLEYFEDMLVFEEECECMECNGCLN